MHRISSADKARRTGIILDSVTSTNHYLASQWNSAAPYTWVAARHQTAGRGRLGRAWEAPRSTSLLVSVLVPVPRHGANPAMVTMAAALATRTLISTEIPGAPISLKWPNDVLIGGAKVAGILAEHAGSRGEHHLVVVGVGLNLTTPPEILKSYGATALTRWGWLHSAQTVPDGEIRRLAGRLTALLELTIARGNTVSLFREHCATLGQLVTVSLPGGDTLTGVADGIGPGGELLVDGTPVHAGEVTLNKNTNMEELS